MLFNLEGIERELAQLEEEQQRTWRTLLDKLRVDGLMDYWLSDAYHEKAAEELAKVRQGKEPYEIPVWLLKAKRAYMRMGSLCKQAILKMAKK